MNISMTDRTDYSDVADAYSRSYPDFLIASHTDWGPSTIVVEYYVGNKICLTEYSEDYIKYIDSVKEIDGGFLYICKGYSHYIVKPFGSDFIVTNTKIPEDKLRNKVSILTVETLSSVIVELLNHVDKQIVPYLESKYNIEFNAIEELSNNYKGGC